MCVCYERNDNQKPQSHFFSHSNRITHVLDELATLHLFRKANHFHAAGAGAVAAC